MYQICALLMRVLQYCCSSFPFSTTLSKVCGGLPGGGLVSPLQGLGSVARFQRLWALGCGLCSDPSRVAP